MLLTMKLMPMVVMARKSSLTRRLGMPSNAPIMPVISVARGRLHQKDKPAFVQSKAEE